MESNNLDALQKEYIQVVSEMSICMLKMDELKKMNELKKT